MSWTKRQLIESAFEELGLAPYVFELQPERMESALRKMDAMIAEWTKNGLQIGYNAPGDLASESGVALHDNQAVYLQLALRLAPSLGKVPSPDTKSDAESAMDTLYIAAAQPLQRQQPRDMPRGEGQKPWRTVYYPFMPPPDTAPISAPMTDNLDIKRD